MRQRHGVFFVWDWKSALYARSLTFARFFSSSPLFFQFFCDIFCLGRVSPPLTSMLNAYKSLPHVLYVQPSAPFTRDTQNEETKNTKCVVCVFLFLPLPLFFFVTPWRRIIPRGVKTWLEWNGRATMWGEKLSSSPRGRDQEGYFHTTNGSGFCFLFPFPSLPQSWKKKSPTSLSLSTTPIILSLRSIVCLSLLLFLSLLWHILFLVVNLY